MFIQTEDTPNPNTMKFLPGMDVMPMGQKLEFRSAKEAERVSPLAMLLFDIPGVCGIFLGEDFVTVTATQSSDWGELRPMVLGRLMDHFTAKMPIVFEDAAQNSISMGDEEIFDEADADIVHEIKELLELRVRPAVAQNGGDIVFYGFKEGVVFLQLKGACSGCPSSTMTLKHGIENMLKHYVPEVIAVEAVDT